MGNQISKGPASRAMQRVTTDQSQRRLPENYFPTESVEQEVNFPRGSRFVTLFELKTPRQTFGGLQHACASVQEDFGCLDIQIEVPRQTQLDHLSKNLKFHAHQVARLERSIRVG